MKNARKIWGLFRVRDKQKFEGVTPKELAFLFRVLGESERAHYLYWSPALERWTPFSDFERWTNLEEYSQPQSGGKAHSDDEISFSKSKSSKGEFVADSNTDSGFSVRSLRQQSRSESLSDDSFSDHSEKVKIFDLTRSGTDDLAIDHRAAKDGRAEVRYDRRFKIRIFTPKGPVKNATLDASMKGLRLEQPLPEGLPEFFHVDVLVSSDKKISLLCSAVKEKAGSTVYRLKIHKNENSALFKAVLFNAA